MVSKKKYRYSNVELLDLIKNSQNKSLVKTAESDLKKRNLSEKALESLESEYAKYLEYKNNRKHKNLTIEEWFTFFILPFFTPIPRWRDNDHFSESEYQRFEKYGFDNKAKQASLAKVLGIIFWSLIFLIGIIMSRYLHL